MPDVVLYPTKAISVKFEPCLVTLRAKSMASKLVEGISISKRACRAEISTGTVAFIHRFAAAEAANRARVVMEICIMNF